MKSLIIALDYDDTYTADPVLWANFIITAHNLGHKVICVTARRDTYENREEMNRNFTHFLINIPIYFCNLKSKQREMDDKGVKVDIWIDDSPFAITQGY